MAIISRRNFKTLVGTADLELEAKKGVSFLVRNIMIYSPTIQYTVLMIGNTTVGYFRVASLLGNHLQIPFGRALHAHNMTMGSTGTAAAGNGALAENAGGTELANIRISESAADDVIVRPMNMAHGGSFGAETILQYLGKKEMFEGYPVASGEKFIVSLVTGATAVKIIEYDIYDQDDITSEMPNGSKSDQVTYISYGDFGAVIQAQVNPVLAESNNPPEFSDFPFGAGVPSKRKIEVLGILATDVSPALNVTGTCTQTEFLRLMKDQKLLFDEDHQGLLYFSPFPDSIANSDMIAEGFAVGGNYTQCDRREPLMFDPPLEFTEGEKLTVMWHTIIGGVGAAISQELQEVAFILRISLMG